MGKSQQTGEGEGGGRKETLLLFGIRVPRAEDKEKHQGRGEKVEQEIPEQKA